jgi:hypothetical protein
MSTSLLILIHMSPSLFSPLFEWRLSVEGGSGCSWGVEEGLTEREAAAWGMGKGLHQGGIPLWPATSPCMSDLGMYVLNFDNFIKPLYGNML